jgi:exodeoxyribonuclease V
MDFELTEGQKAAMKMIEKLVDAPPPLPAVITGFAGTGKTTMLKALASQFGHPQVLAPTGKAALRVQEATGIPASTIHKWLYHPKEDPKTGEIQFRLKDSHMIDRPYNGLVVVDEASMVGRDLWEHLWDMCQLLDLKILLVGDPFQLPPVEGKRPQGEESPDQFMPLVDVQTDFRAHLSEVTRQALDNPVLRASMMLRESSRIEQPLALLNRVFTKNFDDKCMEIHKAGGAIIVHKNDTRHRLNAMVRQRLGYTDSLVEGEPLLVLRNTYEIDRFNGEIITYDGWLNYDGTMKAVRDNWRNVSLMLTFGLAKVDGREVMICPEQIRGEAQAMTESVIARTSKRYYGDFYHPEDKPLYAESEDPDRRGEYLGPPHLHANFGYALTCHKSQGSEWNEVLVMIENSTRPASYEGRRWLYTAITRARKSVYFAMER